MPAERQDGLKNVPTLWRDFDRLEECVRLLVAELVDLREENQRLRHVLETDSPSSLTTLSDGASKESEVLFLTLAELLSDLLLRDGVRLDEIPQSFIRHMAGEFISQLPQEPL